ncbi:MAG TPA: MBL fold metallo-hydrolase [Candidatus Nanoarchaeia archaeon]|nr:MBL fold metallo-hydrolase [Candidatus Nanoarchaeia archaeon]
MIQKIKENVWKIIFEKNFGSCVYFLKTDNKNILIDTGSKENENELKEYLKKIGSSPAKIDVVLLTHDHWDHLGNIGLFTEAEIYHPIELKNYLPEIKTIKIIKTPGHTRDSVCFLYENILFSGDTLFDDGYIGRTDFPESEPEKMQESLKILKKINYDILCPGHNL